MSTTITSSGGATTTPVLVDGYESKRETRTVIHDIIGRPDPDVTLRPAGLRSGELRLLYASESDSLAAEAMHAAPSVFVLASSERASIAMSYVSTGSALVRQLDDETRELWIVTIPFQEVRP